MTLEFNLFTGPFPSLSPLQLNEVEKKLFETEERADLAEVKVSGGVTGRTGQLIVECGFLVPSELLCLFDEWGADGDIVLAV